jgi:hypothetical protein
MPYDAYRAAYRMANAWTLAEVAAALGHQVRQVEQLLAVAEAQTGESYGRRKDRVRQRRPPAEAKVEPVVAKVEPPRCRICGLLLPHECLNPELQLRRRDTSINL